MKYDDASWHVEGDYPTDLPQANAATHIGMFLKWCIGQDLCSGFLLEESEDEIKKVREGSMTGAQFLRLWDEVLIDEMLSETGNLFAQDYYGGDSPFAKKHNDYVSDYEDVFCKKAKGDGYASVYHVEDTDANYARLASKIDERFGQWTKCREHAPHPQESFVQGLLRFLRRKH